MTITCPQCGFSATIDSARVPAGGTTAACPKCACRFLIESPPVLPEPEPCLLASCPACAHEQQFSAECTRCGVIFARYRPPEQRRVAVALPATPGFDRRQLLRYGVVSALALLGMLLLWIVVKDRIPTTFSTVHETLGVTSGLTHSVAVRSDGTVWTWGDNSYGQLGNGRRDAGHGEPVKIPGLEGVTAISVGMRHTLALKKDGTVWSWGDNESYQLGDTSGIVGRTAPDRVAGLEGITAIATGDYFSVALRSDGTLWYFGDNFLGGSGGGTWPEFARPRQVDGISDVVAVVSGRRYIVALRKNGSVWCWGVNDAGQCGDGGKNVLWEPKEIAGLDGVTAIAAGEEFALALKNDGTVWGWGALHIAAGRSLARQSTPAPIVGLKGVKEIRAGYWLAVALKNDGTVWHSDVGGKAVPGEPRGFAAILKRKQTAGVGAIFAGGRNAFLEKRNGMLLCWGPNDFGKKYVKGEARVVSMAALEFDPLAGMNSAVAAAAVDEAGGSELVFRSIAAGSRHSLALASDGTVWAWGDNESGQIASKSKGSSPRPLQVCEADNRPLSRVTAIAAGSLNSLAIRDDGTLWIWGQHLTLPQYVSPSRTGTRDGFSGTPHNAIIPTMIEGVNDAVAVTGGNGGILSFVVLHATGKLSCFGKNDLGLPDRKLRPLDGIADVKALAAGSRHVVALKLDGTVWAWGNNDQGQLGDGTRNQRQQPVRVQKLRDVVRIAAGNDQALAVKSDGTIWIWGGSVHARLPSGLPVVNSLEPLRISELPNIIDIAVPGNGYTGGSHYLALDSSGDVWTWGYNPRGQLGRGTVANEFIKTPVKIENLSGISALAAGLEHSLALRKDGTLFSWGGNVYGQLGDSSSSNSAFPVKVAAKQAAAGQQQ